MVVRMEPRRKIHATAASARSGSLIAAVAVVLLLLAWAGCSQPLDVSGARLVDLTHSFDPRTVYWPTSPSGFKYEVLTSGITEGGYFYAAGAFAAPEHGGTHLDAPIHFGEDGHTVEEIPLRQLIAAGVVIDIEEKTSLDPDYRLTRTDVLEFEARNGKIPPGTIVLLRTGWGRRWPDRESYLGDDTPGDASDLHFPSYGAGAARLLVEERGVAAIGADVASIDYGQSTDFTVHRIAAARNVPGLENLARLDELPETGFLMIALPMKIAGGTGGPLRAVAVVPADSEP